MDSLRLALDTARHEDENGFLHVSMSHITKATVNPYRGDEVPGYEEAGLDPDRIYYAFRAPEELKASLSTWEGLPLQMEHHEEGADAKAAKETRVGTVGNGVRWNAPYVDAPLTIWDQKAIDAVKDGSCRELSCAYYYEPDFTPGTYNGVPYDFVMRKIRGNHVALVPEGRAGHDVLVADSKLKTEENKMPKKMARDGDPAVEQKELALGEVIETAGKKLQELHDTDANGNVQDKPQPDAPEAHDGGLDEIVAKYNITPEDVEALKTALAAPASDEDDAEDCGDQAQDEDEPAADDDEAKDCDAQDEEQMTRDAMEQCGLDPDNPDLYNAFSAGMKNGAGKPSEDADEDADQKEPPVDEEAIAKKAEDRALHRLKADMRSRMKAASDVRCIMGNVNPLSYDSASNIYADALRQAGVPLTGRKPSEYQAMLAAVVATKFPKVRRTAADSKNSADSALKHLQNIRIEG